MKKLLSILLAAVLGLSCMTAAAAQGLNDNLLEVTGMEADWNGELQPSPYSFEPAFSPENVDITVTFAEDEPEVLTKWQDYGQDWFWEIQYAFDAETNKVTFYYVDTKLCDAYLATLDDQWEDYDWNDLVASAPQATITLPTDWLAKFIDAQKPWPALKLGEAASVTADAEKFKVLTFTPEADGMYYFSSANATGNPYAALLDADYNLIAEADGNYALFGSNLASAMTGLLFAADFAFYAELEAGKTYYLLVTDWYGGGFDVTVQKLDKMSGTAQWIYTNLLGGKYWLPLFTAEGYLLPGYTNIGVLWEMLELVGSGLAMLPLVLPLYLFLLIAFL